jgi:hypothetical protein
MFVVAALRAMIMIIVMIVLVTVVVHAWRACKATAVGHSVTVVVIMIIVFRVVVIGRTRGWRIKVLSSRPVSI